ncbi:DUF1707 SHOCT-like domain-containing protein [Algivirga pacifica]|uniref:Cell wall-active antibiotics response LiaF-like C-terminal domain-containing protein n=1 Tax=Algivirga pacifica TaxID=1162670 RepID=A0ABP9D8H0_9BACT
MKEKTTFGLPKKREEIIQLLQKAFTEHNLEEFDFEERLQKAYEAKSIEALEDIVHDFPGYQKRVHNTHSFEFERPQASSSSLSSNLSTVTTFLSSSKRSLSLAKTPQGTIVQTLLGESKLQLVEEYIQENNLELTIWGGLSNTDIDLSKGILEGKHITININSLASEVRLILPKGVRIMDHTQNFLGHLSQKTKKKWRGIFGKREEELTPPQEYTLTLQGLNILSEIKIMYV